MFLECLKKKGDYPLASIEFEKFKYRNYECSSWLEYYLPSDNVILLFHQDNFDTIQNIFKNSVPIFSTGDGEKKVLSFFQGISNKTESKPDSEDDDKAKREPDSKNNKMDKTEDGSDSEDDIFMNDNNITIRNIAEWVYAYVQAPYSYNLDRSKADAYNKLKKVDLNDEDSIDTSFTEVFQDFLMNLNIFYIKKEELYNNLIYYGLSIENKLSVSDLEKLYEYCFQEKYLVFLSYFRHMEDMIRATEDSDFITDSNINWEAANSYLGKEDDSFGYHLKSVQDDNFSLPDFRNAFSHESTMSKRFEKKKKLLEQHYCDIMGTLLHSIQELAVNHVPQPPK